MADTTKPGMSDSSYAMLLHLSPILGIFVAIPFANVIAPLVMWLIRKDQSPLIERVGREALNFQITVMLGVLACIVGGLVTLFVGFIITIPIMILIGIADIVLCIIAAVAANEGREYKFPICLRLVQAPNPGAGPV